jgi:predicted alpha/beta-fold hydrolase
MPAKSYQDGVLDVSQDSLDPSPFRPFPFLRNPHAQTLLGHLMPGPHLAFPTQVRTVALADGDRLAVHENVPRDWRDDQGVVIVVHGLGGSHRSGYMLRLAKRFLQHGCRVLRVDLRGAGAGAGLARQTYHAGCSSDLRVVVIDVHQRNPGSEIVLVGMSLGGNIVLKLAGEAGADPVPGLRAVAAMGPPIDLERCAFLMAQRPFYDRYFARNLVKQVRWHQRHFPEVILPDFPRRPTMRQFDDLLTAPRWGFADALDYYRRASALPVLSQVRVPAFILTARDDPFIAVESFEDLPRCDGLEVHIAEHGGHLGFLGRDGGGGFRWAERRVFEWVLRQFMDPISMSVEKHSPFEIRK